MIIDLHVHEKTNSQDSILSLEEIIQQGEAIGLDGVCITDHESQDIRFLLARYRKTTRMSLFYGAEILTPHGDLLVFGLDDLPSLQGGTSAFIHEVNRRGGALVSAHPFRKNNRGFGDAIRKFSGIHRVAGYNGNTPYRYNMEAVSIAVQLGIPLVGGSDAHSRHRLGVYATEFLSEIHSEKQLAQALRSGQGWPVMLTADGFQHVMDPAVQREAV